MTLTCDNNTREISGSKWKFNQLEIKNSKRRKITNSAMKSTLTVDNVIPADSGK